MVKSVRVTGSKSSLFAIYVAKVAVKNCSGKLQFCIVLGQKHSLGQKVVPDVSVLEVVVLIHHGVPYLLHRSFSSTYTSLFSLFDTMFELMV